MTVEALINEIICRTCVDEFWEGSPKYGALKYVVPSYDLTVIKQHVRIPPGEKVHKFGIKMQCGVTWTTYEVIHELFVAQIDRLQSFGVQKGYAVHQYYVDYDRIHDRVVTEHVIWEGDAQAMQDVLQDVVMYLNLVQE